MNTKVFNKIKNQLELVFPVIIKLYTPILLLLLLTLVISFKTDISPSIFTRDPAVIAGSNGVSSSIDFPFNPLVGFISNIGVLFWCISASICFFSFVILENLNKINSRQKSDISRFLYFSGIITSILLFDDLFLFHEAIFPYFLKIPEKLVYFGYATGIFYWILRFRKTILKTECNLLFLSLFFFGFSLITDAFLEFVKGAIFLEDGFKLFGIVSWFGYFVRVCFRVLNNTIQECVAKNSNYLNKYEVLPNSDRARTEFK